MTGEPALAVRGPRDARAVVLVLHGGREHGVTPVRPTHLAVMRMAPFASALRRAGSGHGLAVARLRYQVRGWNGTARSPVPDVEWALDRLAAQFTATPIALVGHSMGGRAAIYAAGHHAVRAVVGLAPWIERDDPTDQVGRRHVLVVHGDHDRITSPRRSAAWTQQASSVAASAGYVAISGERHAMLRRAALWHSLTAHYVSAVMLGVRPEGSPAADVIAKILAGDASLVV